MHEITISKIRVHQFEERECIWEDLEGINGRGK